MVVVQLLRGNTSGAVVAGIGLALSVLTVAISRLSGWHVWRMLELTYVFAMTLQFGSESFKVFELLLYWDKVVHPIEIFLACCVITLLLLGYRTRQRLNVPDQLAAAYGMMFGISLGAVWELVEFGLDWFANTNLQKSNADTMTDILTNTIGAVFGTLFGMWLFHHRTSEHQRDELGRIAGWLTAGFSRLLARHGVAAAIVLAVVSAAIVLAGYLVDRVPIPPLSGAPGRAAAWSFATASAAEAPPSVALLGAWDLSTERGACLVPPPGVIPGSEKMGLLRLNPQQAYGVAGAPFGLSARYWVARPPLGDGTVMDAGLAFGIRDAEDFYLARVSALHDTVTLERYVHGRRRYNRDERLRTSGNEWHDLSVQVAGDAATVSVDGNTIFREMGLVETAGGVGLWARATLSTCFSTARVEPL